MNYCVISGKIASDIDIEYNKTTSVCKFTLKNTYFDNNKNVMVPTLVRCMCHGALADYVNAEMYCNCNVIITGRIIFKRFIVKGATIDKFYISCTTVSKLEQEEYS